MTLELTKEYIQALVQQALIEDIGSGDLTAQLIPLDKLGQARVFTREFMVVAGQAFVDEVFRQLDPEVKLLWHVKDKDHVVKNTTLFEVKGRARSLLTAERSALNFLQMLSGTATSTYHWLQQLKGTNAQLLDTRKTIPLFRLAQKYAVACGGGRNHRLGLYDAFLIKENHIVACGSITEAIKMAKNIAKAQVIEVEVECLEQLQEAISAGADRVMLDNFCLEEIYAAVKLNQARVKLEVSGGIDLEKIKVIAASGVDFISVGSLTKNLQAIDLSMRFFE